MFVRSSELVMFLGPHGTIESASAACRQMFGVEPDDLVGLDSLDLVHPDDRERVRVALSSVPSLGDHVRTEFRVIDATGRVLWLDVIATNLVDDPNIGCVLASLRDVTERFELLQRIEADRVALAHQATHDWLTQLPNAASLHTSLQSALANAAPDRLVAIALVDIDQFRLVNDRNGHALGDQVLRAVAARLRAGLPSSDFVARFGGDEFVIVRAGVGTIDEARELGVRAIDLLHEPVRIIDRDLQLTISVGVALSTAADSPDSLLRDVDDAMYQAKRDGRNRVIAFDDSARARAHRRQGVAAALPLALERDELHLEYQPIVDVATLETAGFEALLRWEHPDLGTIPPDEFIPIAEASGLILQIGAWVLEHASRQLAAWRADERVPAELWMAINLSASQLAQPHLATHVEAAIQRAGAPPAAIHLEIAEGVLMDRIDHALNTIVELQAIGVRVSIDDFGTGYSSLSYLSRLPVDTIKVDRSFVSGLGGAGHGRSIIRATIALADTLNLDVVAEGVELPSQLDLLRELGCTYAQGFFWSRSLRPAAALEWMIERTAMLHLDDHRRLASRPPASAKSPVDVGQAIVDIAHTSGGRRRTSADVANILRFDSLEVGLSTRKAWLAGRDLDLTVREFDLLAFLTEHPGQVFSRTELLHEVWHSSPTWQNPATVTEHIHRLRSRIEPNPARPRLICTVRGRGYCFGTETVGISA